MLNYPFIKASLPGPDVTARSIAMRLVVHLLRLSAARAGVDLSGFEDASLYEMSRIDKVEGISITQKDHRRANGRASRLYDRMLRESGVGHFTKEDRVKLQPLADGVRLARISDDHQADAWRRRCTPRCPGWRRRRPNMLGTPCGVPCARVSPAFACRR
ncbi:hypothetical protein [Paracoccus beibuensis]|uniref:hypothetical protein n=1 Tax=Paracoccus beibuensis TaxID=547602 RepID=UPI00223FF8E9|nr:hypothetical protein [Paracoccus beibuensis]